MPKYPVPADCQIPTLPQIYESHFQCGVGTFVEIGAFDGRVVSNTCGLADAGWTGYYVEANPAFAAVCATNHNMNPKVSVIPLGVSDEDGEADFWLIGECSTMVWDTSAVEWGGKPDNKIKVKVTTLDNLLAERTQVKPGFELLVIDVEQAEIKVLSGFDILRWQPQMVIIEAHEQDQMKHRSWKAVPINLYFHQAGYDKIYSDHINSIYVKRSPASA